MNKYKNNLAFVDIENVNGQSYILFDRQWTSRSYKVNNRKRRLLASNMINVKCLELMSTHIYPNRIRIVYIKEL